MNMFYYLINENYEVQNETHTKLIKERIHKTIVREKPV